MSTKLERFRRSPLGQVLDALAAEYQEKEKAAKEKGHARDAAYWTGRIQGIGDVEAFLDGTVSIDDYL